MLQWIEEPAALGQVAPTDWTGVPRPPFWDFTGLPWPLTGPLPAQPPPGWFLIANAPPPPGWVGKWPPDWPPTAADVPGWPAGWPFPLPTPPPSPPSSTLPVPPQAPAPPPATAPPSSQGGGAGPLLIAAVIGGAVLLFLIAARPRSPMLHENPCGCSACSGGA